MTWNPAVGVPMLIIGVIVLVAVWLFGQPRKPGQGKRIQGTPDGGRREPVLGEAEDDVGLAMEPDDDVVSLSQPRQGELDVGFREELERLGESLTHPGDAGAQEETDETAASTVVPDLGRRPQDLPVDQIVTLFVVARDEARFQGADFVVAAEKVGLEFGDMGIFHRLLDGKPEAGPIFSVANMVKPGNFDMARVGEWDTPGLSVFMALPGPLPALDAWDAMLPTAQRLAELLDGLVLDEERNALGRQRIAHIRDGLRAWDRRHEGEHISFDR